MARHEIPQATVQRPAMRIEAIHYDDYQAEPVSVVITDARGTHEIGHVDMRPGIIGEGGYKRVRGLLYVVSDTRDPHGDMDVAIGATNMPVTASPLQPVNLVDRADAVNTFRAENRRYGQLQNPGAMYIAQSPVPRTQEGTRHIIQDGVELGHGLDEAIDIIQRQLFLGARGATIRNGDLMMEPVVARFMLLNLVAGAAYTLDSFHSIQLPEDGRSLLGRNQWHVRHPVHGDMGDYHLNNLLVEPLNGSLSVIDVSHVRSHRVSQEVAQKVFDAGDNVIEAGKALNQDAEIGRESQTLTHYLRTAIDAAGFDRYFRTPIVPDVVYKEGIWPTDKLQALALDALREVQAAYRLRDLDQAYTVAREQYLQAFIWTQIYDERQERIHNLRSVRSAAQIQYYEEHLVDLPQYAIEAYARGIREAKRDQSTLVMTFIPPQR